MQVELEKWKARYNDLEQKYKSQEDELERLRKLLRDREDEINRLRIQIT